MQTPGIEQADGIEIAEALGRKMLGRRFSLQRREPQSAPAIVIQQESDRAMTEAAVAVVEDDGSVEGCGLGLGGEA